MSLEPEVETGPLGKTSRIRLKGFDSREIHVEEHHFSVGGCDAGGHVSRSQTSGRIGRRRQQSIFYK